MSLGGDFAAVPAAPSPRRSRGSSGAARVASCCRITATICWTLLIEVISPRRRLQVVGFRRPKLRRSVLAVAGDEEVLRFCGTRSRCTGRPRLLPGNLLEHELHVPVQCRILRVRRDSLLQEDRGFVELFLDQVEQPGLEKIKGMLVREHV